METSSDLELALEIHNAVMPERAASVADVLSWRQGVPERLELVARVGGEPAGEGLAAVEPHQRGRSAATLDVCVLPERRRQGVGSTLYRAFSAWAGAHGCETLEVLIEAVDTDSLAFAERRGFAEIGRDSRLVLDLTRIETPAVEAPAGIEITTWAERPGLVRGMYEVALEALPDIPGGEDDTVGPFEEWLANELGGAADRPEATFVALAGDEVVGYAKFHLTEARPTVALHDITGVKRAWRGRGIARTLKQAEIAWAKQAGYKELQTRNELRNEPIRKLNEQFGYRELAGMVFLRGPLG